MLVGREPERARIDRLLHDARAGRSGALLLVGEAGIGKTALLEHARAEAVAAGMPVLRARGMQTESDLPFAGLGELLGPLLDRLDAIPPTQATALRGALALGEATGGDRYAVMAGVLSLLAAAAEERPVLALVDDCQWLDDSSLEALLFAGRRLGAEGIVLLGSYRGTEVPIGPWLERLEIGPLEAEDARRLLSRAQGTKLALPVAERLVDGTGGNPLALLEVPTLLSDAQLEGREPLASPLRPGAGIKAAFRRRVERLPEDAQRAVLVAAATESGGAGRDPRRARRARPRRRRARARRGGRPGQPRARAGRLPPSAAALDRLLHRLRARPPDRPPGARRRRRAGQRRPRVASRLGDDRARRGGRGRARGGGTGGAPARRARHRGARPGARRPALPRRRRRAPGGCSRRRATPPRSARASRRSRYLRAAAERGTDARHGLRDPPPAREHPYPHRARPGRLPRADRRGRRRPRRRPAARGGDVPRGVDLPDEHRRHARADQRRRPGARAGRGARAGARAARGDRDRRGVPGHRRAGRGRGAAADRASRSCSAATRSPRRPRCSGWPGTARSGRRSSTAPRRCCRGSSAPIATPARWWR